MSEPLIVTLTFLIIVLLLRIKINVGYVLLIASAFLALLHRMPVYDCLDTIQKTALNPITIKLLFALSLIRMFELILREKNVLASMMAAVKRSVKSRRAVIISMPMLIGMLPSLGGAYFSAPMVKEATSGMSMNAEEKAFINYWFRHPWEYVLPLYPGVLLASAVSGIPLYNLISANSICAIILLTTGFIFSMRGLGKRQSDTSINKGIKGVSTIWKDSLSFLPVALVLLLVMILRIELHYALLIAVVPLIFLYRYKLADVFRILKHGFAMEVIILIAGVMLFKETMDTSGAVKNLSSIFLRGGVPVFPMLCLLPFLTGLLTGLTVGFVGSTFPILITISGGASLANISLAFASGFIGVLLSPVHLCLVLTKEFFKADMAGVYRKLVPACGLIFASACIEYLLIR